MADRAPAQVTSSDLLGYDDPSKAPESTAVEHLVLKRGALFAVTNRMGNIAPAGARDMGLYWRDTRFLSLYHLEVAGGPPVRLSSQSSREYVSQVDLTCTRAGFGGVFQSDPVNFLHLRREQLVDDRFCEQITLTNFVTRRLDYWIELGFAADFADIFEARGHHRDRRGTYYLPEVSASAVILRYTGLDGRRYATEVRFAPAPLQLEGGRARFELHLEPNETAVIQVEVLARVDEQPIPPPRPFRERVRQAQVDFGGWRASCARFVSSDEVFTLALEQAVADLKALLVEEGGFQVVSAGVPWFAAPFGRDTLITGFEALPVTPGVARDALRYLAAHQGKKVDPETEEEPGKIMHELRHGEMATAREVPHRPYYGSVDATPLFLILLSEYYLWTSDAALVESLWPAAEAAMAWMERYGDKDGDLFLEYQRVAEKGLINQGWKDSRDGVCYADGAPVEAPVALVEVQGYACDAYRRMSHLCRRLALGDAHRLSARSRALARRIEEQFHVVDTRYYALALDSEKRQVKTITSNPGHLLFTRAIPEPRAREVLSMLLGKSMWSGWGIRTLALGQGAYNPLSYHNGTIWPHDNAIIALGASFYGHTERAVEIMEGLYAALQHFSHFRPPELFCGLSRGDGDFPVNYPVACSPQAWSSASLFMLVRAMLGIHPDAPRSSLAIRNPQLPWWMTDLRIEGMRIGQSKIDLHFTRTGEGCFAAVTKMLGPPISVHIDVQGGSYAERT